VRADLLERVSELRAARKAFVVATVVRVAKPASAHTGDSAILLPDGTLEGFVGGMCSESTVRTQGLRQLATGRSVLLHITPPPAESMPQAGSGVTELGLSGLPVPRAAAEDAGLVNSGNSGDPADSGDEVTVGNPCLSGGALDIFLEVMRPAALIHLYGDTPVARALAAVGAAAGLDVRPTGDPGAAIPADATAVVVASQGGDEHRVITAALDAGVPYVGLLASRRRGSAVLDALGLEEEEERGRIHTPAGLDIGAQSPGEVAVSIIAEIIAVGATTHPFGTGSGTGGRGTGVGPAVARGLVEATDPICGMTLAVTENAIRSDTPDGTFYFCCPGCRDAFLAEPERYTRSL
jgi:xanthine dehydrogenase accessory factor